MTKTTDHPYGPMAGIENGRAKYAFTRVEAFIQENKDSERDRDSYRAYIKRLPSIIKTNGLGEALAFYYSQKGIHYHIYCDIADWIKHAMPSTVCKYAKDDENSEFIKLLISMKSDEYRLVTVEVLAL